MTPKQRQEIEVLISILQDVQLHDGWTSEPQARRAAYAWAALHGQYGPGSDW